MVQRESSRSIDEAAADWAARLDRGPLSAQEADALEAWLSGDPRRRGAMLRARALALLSLSAQGLGPQFDPEVFAPRPDRRTGALSRRAMLAWGGGGVALAGVAMVAVAVPAAGAITTDLGEVRLVTLEDGSTIMLNTETRVRVRYSRAVRRVELVYGEAYFSVVRDQARSFLVDASPAGLLRASRGTFRVRKLRGAPVDVLVDQGGVVLQAPQPVTIAASNRLVVSEAVNATPQTLRPEQVTRELAWRQGKIAFEGEPLAEAAAQFARYSRTRIEIRDPDLAREPVIGLFSASDPVGFSRAAAEVFGARMEQVRGTVVLSRRPEQL